MTDISLIKEAAVKMYKIKLASAGYENGYIYELSKHFTEPLPDSVKDPLRVTGGFIYNHPVGVIGGALAAGIGWHYWDKYKKYKKQQEAKKRRLPKVIPEDTIVKDSVPEDVLAKESSYNKVNKVLNWIYS